MLEQAMDFCNLPRERYFSRADLSRKVRISMIMSTFRVGRWRAVTRISEKSAMHHEGVALLGVYEPFRCCWYLPDSEKETLVFD